MKQIIASVLLDILFYTIGNIIFCIFKYFELNLIIITARGYKFRLAEVNFLSCFNDFQSCNKIVFLIERLHHSAAINEKER